MEPDRSDDSRRWSARPVLSVFLRAFIFLAPSVASLAVGLGIAQAVEPPEGTLATWGWWAGILVASALHDGRIIAADLT